MKTFIAARISKEKPVAFLGGWQDVLHVLYVNLQYRFLVFDLCVSLCLYINIGRYRYIDFN